VLGIPTDAGGFFVGGFMTITISWWMIPTIISIVAIVYVYMKADDGGGMFSGLDNLLALIPALAISLVVWIIAAFLK
jgi:hypothetical protein